MFMLAVFCIMLDLTRLPLASAFCRKGNFALKPFLSRELSRRFSIPEGIVPDAPSVVPTPPVKPVEAIKASDLSLLEIRVGKIVEIGKHPEADSLYVEKVDVGEATGPRTIVSGLVQFCTAEELLNRAVIVLCNLKPRALKGITSHGMLLCASNADHTQVEPLAPPADTPLGELITFIGHPNAPAEPGNRASKAFTKVADDLFVNDNQQATYKDIPFMTTKGPVTASLKGKIS